MSTDLEKAFMSNKAKKPPLTLEQYKRLYTVIQSLSDNWAKDAGRACVFFSITGAVLMNKHYQLKAKVICGSGAILIDPETGTALSWFQQNQDGTLTTGINAFHTWIECDGWLIDLMAPNYREALHGATGHATDGTKNPAPTAVPRMMLQKPIAQTEGMLDDMKMAGDCVFVPDGVVTKNVIDRAFESPNLGDLLNIALVWHRPLPKRMEPSITITDDLGKIQTIKLMQRDLIDAW